MVFGVDGRLIGCRVMMVVRRRIVSRRRMLLCRHCVIVIGS
jgi:hypothetical protein